MTVAVRPLTEAEFQAQVIDLATVFGWECAHFRPALTQRGWWTPVQGSLGKGFPDLILVRPKDQRLILAELKRTGAKASPDQERVLNVFGRAGVEIHVWYPVDFDRITETLR